MTAKQSGVGWMLAGLFILGCSGEPRPSLAKVHGKVSLQGKPLTSGRILFVPSKASEGELSHPASGKIGDDGSFTLTSYDDGDGAMIGEHKVAVIVTSAPGAKAPGTTVKSPVPKQFADPETTPLRKKVEPGDNAIDINLE